MKKILLPLMFLILVMGCAKKQDVVTLSQQIDTLEKELGPYRYGGFHPKLKLTLLEEEFKTSSYGSPRYEVNGVVRFIDDFPLENIGVSIDVKLTFTDDHVAEGSFYIEMRERSEVFEDYVYLTDIPNGLSGVKPEIEVVRGSWWPISELPVEVIRK